jgi:hypothetical protein
VCIIFQARKHRSISPHENAYKHSLLLIKRHVAVQSSSICLLIVDVTRFLASQTGAVARHVETYRKTKP